jgi:hypothetical protein
LVAWGGKRPDPIGPLWCLFPDPPDTGCSFNHLGVAREPRYTPVISLPTDFRGGKGSEVCTGRYLVPLWVLDLPYRDVNGG